MFTRAGRKVKILSERPQRILPIIILSQFSGTSLWFAGNAVLGDLQQQWQLGDAALGYMTSSVQLGFICGTLIFAFFMISDRFSPRNVFFVCSLLGAVANVGILVAPGSLMSLLALRYFTGFFLAGIYPVGMKIAAGWYRRGLGQALGYLVGALVVGTAFPHLLKSTTGSIPWQNVIVTISALAALGGVLILLLVPDGPNAVKGTKFNSRAIAIIFRSKDLRSASFGYFGHMWELYALWAFFPIFITAYGAAASQMLNVPFWSFVVIAAGFLGCAGGGHLSMKLGSPRVAFFQLLISGICCLLSPLLFHAPPAVFLAFICLWGITVVGDSPQFSALTAQTAPLELVGSALTIVTCIGFLITIFSIQFASYLLNFLAAEYIFLFLIPGPIFGLINLWPLYRKSV
ncbi:MAG: MFS transporter [Desulfobacterales bacterium]|nr:MFS transporter [Desulfobacterales bacterium]